MISYQSLLLSTIVLNDIYIYIYIYIYVQDSAYQSEQFGSSYGHSAYNPLEHKDPYGFL